MLFVVARAMLFKVLVLALTIRYEKHTLITCLKIKQG
jgi:hypothetical protein